MTRPIPNLGDPDERTRYRNELRQVAQPLRLGGIALAWLGVGLALLRVYGGVAIPAWLPLSLLGPGIALMFAAIVVRTRYHRQRMRGQG